MTNDQLKHIKVLPILESLQFINQNNASVVRFGDGEIDIITGHSIPYQTYNEQLAKQLLRVLQTPSSKQLLVCLPDVFERMERYNSNARYFWKKHFEMYQSFYMENCRSPWYGSTFLSRPYIDLEDKNDSNVYFEEIKKIWINKPVLIVEGETSRSGVGNDLFDQAKSVERIICPSKNAYDYYEQIKSTVLEYAKDHLIIVMLGPTAKVLCYDLAQQGYTAIDLGHIDSEYEWYQMKATHKIKLNHKHTAEFNQDDNINLGYDEDYHAQIIDTVGVSISEPQREDYKMTELISIIIPVYNVEKYLGRCIDSILKQTYQNFEVLLINDGSTDNSAFICEDYAKKDNRVRVYHQENQGPSAARNKGLLFANGEYITFIDSDDFVEDYYLNNLYQAAIKNEADIACCNFNSFNEERQSFLFFITDEKYFEKVYSVQEWIDQENTGANNLFLTVTFTPMKLFKRFLFDNVQFPVGRLREDDATIYKLYLKANKIAFINEGTYYYSQRREGLSRNGMLQDIEGMISNAEERIALLVTLGYDVSEHIQSYVNRLRKCQRDSLNAGQIELYQQISLKLDLIENHSN